MPVKVTVCVGSSCHIRGSRDVLKRFAQIIKQEGLEQEVDLAEVALVGSFCMERCGECMNWRFENDDISSESLDQAAETLRQRLVEVRQRS